MALLAHMSAEMSLRYGRLFDATVRTEYERAVDLAKQQALTPATDRTSLPLRDITGGKDWKDTPLVKSRGAGGFCLRAPVQGACAHANICEHCPTRLDRRSGRHKQLINKLDALLGQATAG